MTCLFLSTKVENAPIGLEEFLGKIPKSPNPNQMIELELTLSNGIGIIMVEINIYINHRF